MIIAIFILTAAPFSILPFIPCRNNAMERFDSDTIQQHVITDVRNAGGMLLATKSNSDANHFHLIFISPWPDHGLQYCDTHNPVSAHIKVMKMSQFCRNVGSAGGALS